MRSFTFAALAALLNVVCIQAASAKDGPNIVFIMTDDQDKLMDSLDYMPNVKAQLADKGVSYQRHYCTISLCCPSRVSLLTGRAAHNTNVTSVAPPYGGYPKFIKEGLNSAYLPVWLQNAGYNTYYAGKLMNGQSTTNYNAPFAAGFNTSAFLLDPGMYIYMNSTWQTGTGAPQNFPGEHILDINSAHAYDFIDDAATKDSPFFITIAPVAPHAQFVTDTASGIPEASIPVPQEKWKNSFLDQKVPRTANFNPDVVSGGSWIRELPQLDADTVAYNDAFYVARLQLVAGVDDMVGEIVSRLDAAGLLDSTYIVFTADNGYHIGQHRLQPGKSCPVEEDYNVPLIIRGPNIPAGKASACPFFHSALYQSVTTHTDLAPTFFEMLGLELRAEFDGAPIPVTAAQISAARADASKAEHINIEYWGPLNAANEGNSGSQGVVNNTYKSARIVGESYNLFYTVWCDNTRELYDMSVNLLALHIAVPKLNHLFQVDQYQMNNLLVGYTFDVAGDLTFSLGHSDVANFTAPTAPASLSDDLPNLVARLDALTMVLKSCKTDACRSPWSVLHPKGDVKNLADAMAAKFDDFYAAQPKVAFSECSFGYLIASEGPQDAVPYAG
ncbi:putative arylsulfatase [Mycena vulgaris]|nr:putative arylsulfatase [Mycena vulgaris]